MKFGLKNYFEPTPKNIQKWMLAVKGIIGTVAGASYVGNHEPLAFSLLIGGAVLDQLANLFSE